MADYTKTTNFTAKDSLSSGDPSKIIRGSEHDTEYNAIATMSATKVDKTSDNTITAAHTFSGNVKFTGTPVFNATANVITASGTDTYTGTVGWTAYATGQQLAVKFTNANTTAATLNIDSLGAKSIVNYDGSALAGGEIPALGRVGLVYDGTNFVIQYISKLAIAGNVPVRQTVLAGAVDSTAGTANFISAGSGLACNLAATTTPVVATFAAGFNADGQVDYVTRVSADASSFVSSLSASNRSYIYIDRDTSTGSITYGKTLIPPQYGYVFDRTKQSLLRFPGADASTTILDDYGNTWTANGNAQIDTGVTIDGENTLLLDGTGDSVQTANITSLGDGSWTLEAKVRFAALPGAGANAFLFGVLNGSGYGLQLGLNNTAGTYKLIQYLSSTGSSADISAGTLGTSTTWAINTTYHIAITYDAVAGKYFVYKDGVAEAALTVTSTSKICAVTTFRLGENGVGASYLNGSIAGFRFSPCCRYPNGTTFAAPTLPFSVEGDHFDIPSMKMYQITAASGIAGTNPTMTQKHRVYMGEAVTDASSVTSAITYALKGRYDSLWFDAASSTDYSKNHYLGQPANYIDVDMFFRKHGSAVVLRQLFQEAYNGGNYTSGSLFEYTNRLSYKLWHNHAAFTNYLTTRVGPDAFATTGQLRVRLSRGW